MFRSIREYLCFFIFIVIQREILTFKNIAYRRKTLSSVPLYSSKSVPDLVVDGRNYNTSSPVDEQCFITSNITQKNEPCWLAIDFGKTYFVPRMVFRLADNNPVIKHLNAYNSLNNSTISLTETNPEVNVPMPIRPCKKISLKNNGIISSFDVFCNNGNPIGRYLIVQQSVKASGYLNFCELEIFGMKYKDNSIFSRWIKYRNSRISNAWIGWPDTLRTIFVRSSLECLSICISLYRTSCTALNYKTSTKLCMFAMFADPFPSRNEMLDWLWMAPHGISYDKNDTNFNK